MNIKELKDGKEFFFGSSNLDLATAEYITRSVSGEPRFILWFNCKIVRSSASYSSFKISVEGFCKRHGLRLLDDEHIAFILS